MPGVVMETVGGALAATVNALALVAVSPGMITLSGHVGEERGTGYFSGLVGAIGFSEK
jgi:hypothetical protein